MVKFLRSLKFYSGEWITLAYIFITTAFLLLNYSRLSHPSLFFGMRLSTVALIFFLSGISRDINRPYIKAFRQFIPFLLLEYWYSETYDLGGLLLPNQDAFFCLADQRLFGGEPSILFSQYFPQSWFSELMYFGYFSYYLIAFGIPILFLIKYPEYFNRSIFVILCSFYLYYLIYIILPVGGPQFYFSGALRVTPPGYLFSHLIHYIQMLGEKPTGAFPSSHVGISTVVLLLTFSKARKVFWQLLPLYCILVLSTVYIKAHYMVDVLGGFVSAVFFYELANHLFDALSDRFYPEADDLPKKDWFK